MAVWALLPVPASAAAPLANTSIVSAQATAEYTVAGSVAAERILSNVVVINIAAVESATLTQDQSVQRPPGSPVTLTHLLRNTGNVASSYTFAFNDGGAGCPATTFNLPSRSLVHDLDGNGLASADEPVLAVGPAGVLTLAPGQAASLIVQGSTPAVSSGRACFTLSAISNASTPVSASNRDIVTLTTAAILSVSKSASYPGVILPGSTVVPFEIIANNIGAAPARTTGTATAVEVPVVVDGVARSLVLLRDVLPAGLEYVAGSLQSSLPGALRLFRDPNDPPFSYRSAPVGGSADMLTMREIAIGIPTDIDPVTSVAMRFSARVLASASPYVSNQADAFYNNGATVTSTSATSNSVLLPVSAARVGLAKSAGTLVPQFDASGVADGTAVVRFSLRVRNMGGAGLYNLQVSDAMEGAGATQFGSFTSQTVPGVGEYTIVPGSVSVALNSAATVAVASGYTGQASASGLLAPGSVLPAGGEFTLQFDARINITGRVATMFNTAQVTAGIVPGGSAVVSDISANGSEPDADGNGDPGNDSAATPVSPLVPVLSIDKTVSTPVRISSGVYDLTYTLRVANSGAAPAPHVRLIDNLNCAFDMDLPTGHIQSWQITSSPTSRSNLLRPAVAFTGNAPCERSLNASANPAQLPTSQPLWLTDGGNALPAGQSDEVSFTVRVVVKPAYLAARTTVVNKAWAASFLDNVIGVTPLLQASADTASAVLVDPQGVVYDSISRQPIAGALVNVRRTGCSNTAAGPISAAEVLNGSDPGYTYHSDGSVSMTTGGTGEYQFFFVVPPAPNDLCDYALTVVPPSGSGYVAPSASLPATAGTFTSCGQVVPQSTAPQVGEATTHYFSFRAGVDTGSSNTCEMLHNHIPLDPGQLGSGLVLRKEGSKKDAEFGDFVDYQLTLTNNLITPLSGITVQDSLPPGFAYQKGSTRIGNVAAADPEGGVGPVLTYAVPGTLAPKESLTIRYRLRIGVGAPTQGDAINRARAYAGALSSNLASWRVRISGGVFSDEAFAFGRVYLGCPAPGGKLDDSALPGLPGVRLFMETGASVVTDAEGKWSLYGLKPVSHVIKVDPLTLPGGARLIALDNRNAGDAGSRFLDVKKGEFARADFLVSDCGLPGLAEELASRRKAMESLTQATDDAYKTRLEATSGLAGRTVDVRGLAASGAILGTGGATNTQPAAAPLIGLPAGSMGTQQALTSTAGLGAVMPALPAVASGSTDLLGALPAPGMVDLETALPGEDNRPGFMGLKEGDTLPGRVINVRVKGVAGTALRLRVNGQFIDERRVGKKATLPSSNLAAWEYIGVELQPGSNELRLSVQDDFGNVRADERISVIAPDRLGAIELDLPPAARADLRTPVTVRLRLVDAKGVPVTARTYITLDADRGRWLDNDLNASEPGTQIAVEGGTADLTYIPPGEPGEARLRASNGALTRDVRLQLLPEQRPMVGIGIVEGVLDFSKRGTIGLGRPGAANAFEAELSGFARERDDFRAAARTAFYLKGTVKGDYLLTAAYDSDKTTRDRLFRDIRPDEYYPVYGDNSVRGYDAQSTQKLYVRIDRNRSYLLYGDFTTASTPEVRMLSQYSRSLTGIKHQFDNGTVRVTSFASRTSATQTVEEIRALGISGPYFLTRVGTSDLIDGSEKVEIIVRDRNQPNVVLLATPATRFVDYTVEPLTGRLMFFAPVASFDENFNPRSIRVTYEVNAGGPEYTVAGTDAQLKVTDWLQLGAVAVKDNDPSNARRLTAATALARWGRNTVIAAEWVRTDSALKGEGAAGRIELRHDSDDLKGQAQLQRTDAGFDNNGGGATAGRTEATGRFEYKLDENTRIKGEAIYSKDDGGLSTSGTGVATSREGVSLAVQRRLSDDVVGEAGLRHGNQTGSAAGSFDYGQVTGTTGASGNLGNTASGSLDESTTTVRGRLTSKVPALPQAQVFAEIEQDIDHSDRHAAAVGAVYALTDRTRLYGRYEFQSSLSSAYNLTGSEQRNVALFGIESGYTDGGRVFNEYRLADTDDGRAAQSAAGIRNTIRLNEAWRINGGLEVTRSTSNYGNAGSSTSLGSTGDATAVVTGVEYSQGPLRASATLEMRDASSTDALLNTFGLAYKLDTEWTLLGRSLYSRTSGIGSNLVQSRQQIGAAYRPVADDRFNALLRYEHKYEDIGNSTTSADGSSFKAGSTGGSSTLPGTTNTHVVAAVANFQFERGVQLTGRYAAKYTTYSDELLRSTYWAQLAHGRYTRDLNADWDIGLQAGLLWGKGGALQHTLGAELGYQLTRNLWLSAGYNVLGLKDPDLTAGEYTNRGGYLRIRFKFDENTFGLGGSGDRGNGIDGLPPGGGSGGPAAAPAAAPAVVPLNVAMRAMQVPAVQAWQPGQPLPARVVWAEAQLFEPDAAILKPAALTLIQALGTELAANRVGDVSITVGHGDTDATRSELWFRRAALLRRILRAAGPRAIDISTDSQALAALLPAAPLAPGVLRSLSIAIHATGATP